MKATATRARQTVSRTEAAAMLRAARRALAIGDDRAGETIGWTLTALRDNIHARLIKIDYLLNTGHWDSADALIARTVMHLRDHPLLRWRLARSLFEQGRLAQAEKEIGGVLQARPEHVGALTLAAQITSAQGRHRSAAVLWMRASDRRPHDQGTHAAFVQALLDAKLTHHAVVEFQRLRDPQPLLAARVLRAQGRILEAIECLDAAVTNADGANVDLIFELIDVLEKSGDVVRFRTLVSRLAQWPAQAQLRAAEAWMTFGDFDQATALAQRVAEYPMRRDRAMRVMLITSALSHGRIDESSNLNIHLSDLSRRDPHAERVATASLWLNAMLGRITVHQIDSRAAGADPFASVLQPLMKQALHLVQTVATNEYETLERREAASAHRDMLAAALGFTSIRTTSHDLAFADQPVTIGRHDDQATALRRAA